MLYAAKSHIGLVRQMNQDGFAVHTDLEPMQLLIVADGMGGASAGEVASKMAVDTTSAYVRERVTGGATDAAQLLTEAVESANRLICQAARDNYDYAGMGTTLVAALISDEQVVLAHVGDSRAYVYQEGQLRLVTKDHSLVAEMVRRGQLTEAEALHHPQRNIVTRSLGTSEFGVPDIDRLTWHAGDVLLLCTDGLSNLLSQGELETAMSRVCSASSDELMDQVADELVRTALERGAPDNLTLVLALHHDGEAEHE